jgi:hypothetical protein
LLNEAEVNIGAPPLDSFGFHGDEEEADDDKEAHNEDVTKIKEGVFEVIQEDAGSQRPTVHSLNYTELEDVLLVRA